MDATLSEIFSSFQGEGPYIGERQIFVRFAGCNLDCSYCDTPQAKSIVPQYTLHTQSENKLFGNPIKKEELLAHLSAFPKNLMHSLSITGGEPLLQVDFLKLFLPETKMKIYLETNGTLPKNLEEIIELVDIISLDFKLPSSTGLSSYLKEHQKCLEIAYNKEVFVKIVVSENTKSLEVDEAAGIIAEIDPEILTILQPASPIRKPQNLFALHAVARRKLKRVRVIPQVHKLLGLK
jgi:organic radical activating enzyme